MKLKDRQQNIYKYGSKIHSDEMIDRVIELFYTLKDNRSSIIAEKTGIKPYQVLGIINRYDENVIKYERERDEYRM